MLSVGQDAEELERSYPAGRGVKWSTLENSLEVSLKLPYDQVILILGPYPREVRVHVPRSSCSQMLTATLLVVTPTANNQAHIR